MPGSGPGTGSLRPTPTAHGQSSVNWIHRHGATRHQPIRRTGSLRAGDRDRWLFRGRPHPGHDPVGGQQAGGAAGTAAGHPPAAAVHPPAAADPGRLRVLRARPARAGRPGGSRTLCQRPRRAARAAAGQFQRAVRPALPVAAAAGVPRAQPAAAHRRGGARRPAEEFQPGGAAIGRDADDDRGRTGLRAAARPAGQRRGAAGAQPPRHRPCAGDAGLAAAAGWS
ncbi:hypothetical protein G6F35_012543 [Rhizopus arrhizus]|nr:hypothetical protein G6F35_012543 [Rhizopus arrhizus]